MTRYDIYALSTIEYFVGLSQRKKGPFLLIMGHWCVFRAATQVGFALLYALMFAVWCACREVRLANNPPFLAIPQHLTRRPFVVCCDAQHANFGASVSGDVDFGPQSVLPDHNTMALRWFRKWYRWLDPPWVALEMQRVAVSFAGWRIFSWAIHLPCSGVCCSCADLPERGLMRCRVGEEKKESKESKRQLPPVVRYFRMGGADGHKTENGCERLAAAVVHCLLLPPLLPRRKLCSLTWCWVCCCAQQHVSRRCLVHRCLVVSPIPLLCQGSSMNLNTNGSD